MTLKKWHFFAVPPASVGNYAGIRVRPGVSNFDAAVFGDSFSTSSSLALLFKTPKVLATESMIAENLRAIQIF